MKSPTSSAAWLRRLLGGKAELAASLAVAIATPAAAGFSAGCLNPLSLLLSAAAGVLVAALGRLFDKYEEGAKKLMVESLLVAGKGLKTEELEKLRLVLRLLAASSTALACFTVVYAVSAGFNLLLFTATASVLAVLALAALAPRLLVYYWSSQRKVAVEVELPYLLILLRVVSALRLPIYDVLQLIESSVALPASAREVKFARKVASFTSTSLLSALDTVYLHNPSSKVSELLRRVVISGSAHGDIKSVVERVFEEVYSWFEARLAGLVEKFTIIAGSSLLVYVFAPVVVATVAPLFGGGVFALLGLVLSAQVFAFFALYAMISSLYPSSLVLRPTTKTTAASLAALAASYALLVYNTFSQPAGLKPLGLLELVALLLAISLPPLILSELELRRASTYDSFVRAASDALSLAAATGENPASAIERLSRRYGKRVFRLAKTVTTSYVSSGLRQRLVARAPSMFHASFLETLFAVLTLGSTPEMLREFSASYERLFNTAQRARGLFRTLEALMAGLAGILSGFFTYLRRVFAEVAASISGVQGVAQVPIGLGYLNAGFIYQVFALLDNLVLASLLFMALIVAKVRTGSLAYYARSYVLMLVPYIVLRLLLA